MVKQFKHNEGILSVWADQFKRTPDSDGDQDSDLREPYYNLRNEPLTQENHPQTLSLRRPIEGETR